MSDNKFIFFMKSDKDYEIMEYVVNESLNMAVGNLEENPSDYFLNDFAIIKMVREIVFMGIEYFKENSKDYYDPLEIIILDSSLFAFVMMNVSNHLGRGGYE